MNVLILIEGEFRSLIRNSLERIISSKFKKKYDKKIEILLKISIRAISSVIALYLFEYIKNIPEIRTYSSYILIIFFNLFYLNE